MVKATPLHSKNAAQHFADLRQLEKVDSVRPAFINPVSQEKKKIECIRVDGGFDEGPPHKEVQYWWTPRHLEAETVVTLVSSPNSGASFRNRVELQNGCLALGHANLFIPSTLNGSCLTASGGVDQNMLRKDLDSAIDVYISRVDGAPCTSTEIHLYKGVDSSKYQEENEVLKVFLKGSKAAKSKLATEKPELYSRVKETWELREKHVRNDVPNKYVFMLQCCFEEDCTHPVCKEGKLQNETWYPGRPILAFNPLPVPDPDHPFSSSDCPNCGADCCGHYMNYDKVLAHFLEKGRIDFSKPPSVVLLEIYNKCKAIPPPPVVMETAKATLLPKEEVLMWFEHLHKIAENRKSGAKKAAATRREKRRPTSVSSSNSGSTSKQSNSAVLDNDERQELCQECGKADPPDCEANTISWISCDGCLLWWHMTCVHLEEDVSSRNRRRWLCLRCNEV